MDTIIIVASEEPNPLIPAPYEIIWGTHLVRDPARAVLEVRPADLQQGHRRAHRDDRGRHRAGQGRAGRGRRSRDAYSEQLEAATKEAAAIRTAAHSEGGDIVNAAKAEAEAAAPPWLPGRRADPGGARLGRRVAAARRRRPRAAAREQGRRGVPHRRRAGPRHRGPVHRRAGAVAAQDRAGHR